MTGVTLAGSSFSQVMFTRIGVSAGSYGPGSWHLMATLADTFAISSFIESQLRGILKQGLLRSGQSLIVFPAS